MHLSLSMPPPQPISRTEALVRERGCDDADGDDDDGDGDGDDDSGGGCDCRGGVL